MLRASGSDQADATPAEIISIRLWRLIEEEGSYELHLTEDEARCLFSDLNQHLPMFRQLVSGEQASGDEESISDDVFFRKMIEVHDQSEGTFRPVNLNEVDKRIQERKRARLEARRTRQEKVRAKKK